MGAEHEGRETNKVKTQRYIFEASLFPLSKARPGMFTHIFQWPEEARKCHLPGCPGSGNGRQSITSATGTLQLRCYFLHSHQGPSIALQNTLAFPVHTVHLVTFLEDAFCPLTGWELLIFHIFALQCLVQGSRGSWTPP